MLAGCDSLSDQGVAARAGDWVLTEERLAELLVLAQPYPLDSLAVGALADLWVSAAAVSQRSAAGDSLQGAEARERSLWLDRREALLSADRVERLGASVALGDAAVEQTFNEGALRLIAHVLRRVGPETSSSEQLLQRRTIERLLDGIAAGGGWSEALAESEDDESRQQGGLLGLFAAGELPSTLDRAAFRLEPGQISGVVQSSRGLHLVYRPQFEEVATLFAQHLFERNLEQADAGAAEGVRDARGFALASGASVVVARMTEEPREWLESEQVLATWDGGVLPASALARSLMFLPRESRAQLAAASEDDRVMFVSDIGTRELRRLDALERGMVVDSVQDENLARLHDEEVEHWTRVLELDASDAPSRDALARYMEAVVARREEARPLPPLLEAWILGRTEHRVRARGVLASIVTARTMIEEAGGAGDPGT